MSALYYALRGIAKLGLRFYYSEISVHGMENLPKQGPIILAINHPNAMMDPILMSVVVKQKVGFLAKKALFVNAFANRFFENIGVIPVTRKEDLKEGEVFDVQSTFEKCISYLENKGTLMIFPEGVSKIERKLRKIKTGTARMAFQMEERADFKAGLQIVTVALHYSNPTRFRSKVTVVFDRPMLIDHYQNMYSQSQEKCILGLTYRIERRLANKTVITENKEEEETLEMIQNLYEKHLRTTFSHRDHPKTDLFLSKSIGKAISHFKQRENGAYSELYKKTVDYGNLLKSYRLDEKLFHEALYTPLRAYELVLQGLFFLTLLPLYFLGLIANIIPYLVALYATPIINRELEFKAGLQLALCIVVFPVWYLLATLSMSVYFGFNNYYSLLLLFTLPLTGLFALHFHQALKTLLIKYRIWFFMRKENPRFIETKTQKKALMELFDKVRSDVFKAGAA